MPVRLEFFRGKSDIEAPWSPAKTGSPLRFNKLQGIFDCKEFCFFVTAQDLLERKMSGKRGFCCCNIPWSNRLPVSYIPDIHMNKIGLRIVPNAAGLQLHTDVPQPS